MHWLIPRIEDVGVERVAIGRGDGDRVARFAEVEAKDVERFARFERLDGLGRVVDFGDGAVAHGYFLSCRADVSNVCDLKCFGGRHVHSSRKAIATACQSTRHMLPTSEMNSRHRSVGGQSFL